MEKIYISVELEKLKQGIIDAVNNSPLPYCLKQMVLDEVAGAVRDAARQEYERDLADMQKAREAAEKEETSEEE